MPSKLAKSGLADEIRRRDRKARAAMQSELALVGVERARQNTRVVSKWGSRPTFRSRVQAGADKISLRVETVGPDKLKWKWVDKGTKPHVIRAKAGGVLRFRVGYIPQTLPTAQFNRGPGEAFGAWRSAKEVFHPGIEARKFDETFNKALLLGQRIAEAVRRALA